jgi:host factor-I protein
LNRKLIRPKLTEINIKPTEEPRSANQHPKNSKNGHQNGQSGQNGNGSSVGKSILQSAQKKAPPQDTNAEIFYYKKQIEGHVPMVLILQDGEQIYGTIEWYDRHALKINRDEAPNILLLKHNIKYMYKDPERT